MKIFTFDQVTSTQDLARSYLATHAHQAAFVANSQTKSYGKRGRSFFSPPNTGVYFSLAVPDFKLNKEKSELLTPAIATALVDILQSLFSSIKLKLKWVNDIYLDNKKVGGILTEYSTNGLIIGVGINISTQVFPNNLQEKAGSIIKQDFNRQKLIKSLLRAVSTCLGAYESGAFLPQYRHLSCLLNKNITLQLGKKVVHGIAVNINERGELVVKSNGQLHSYSSGEVIKVESK
ncbi:biotin--[acetyl-CoA-carboxylase] ligase [Lactobacillus sp. PV034]|uniref:biotin--[acetyl-CoA-carboxylase] ligase n=1 Tax=Lactobacillus sp. PV034 TaxID=2594495 RepID=UPI0022409B15|nr:biotin--[acetyl-CoA-carboxylase] ligase [Lactobacillus sp. PV034]QNQ80957.1 biotin--[acetyl-CoA-carboxylase] ligase [Lactobacillus sp. PV034]